MTLTTDHVINSLSNHLGLPKRKSAALLGSILEIIKNSLENSEDGLISGFGKFSVHEKKNRKGRNPATGDGFMPGARKVVTFTCSSVLREKLNGKG